MTDRILRTARAIADTGIAGGMAVLYEEESKDAEGYSSASYVMGVDMATGPDYTGIYIGGAALGIPQVALVPTTYAEADPLVGLPNLSQRPVRESAPEDPAYLRMRQERRNAGKARRRNVAAGRRRNRK